MYSNPLHRSMFDMMTFAISLTVIFTNILQSQAAAYAPNQHCDVYEGIVPLDKPLYRYTTYFMKLNTCQGADYSPASGRVCKPTKVEKMNISVVSDHGGYQTVTVDKHIACSFECKHNSSICNKYQTWDEDSCSCQCRSTPPVCGKDKEWRKLQCDCMCTMEKESRCASVSKEMNLDTCECIPTGRSIEDVCKDKIDIKYVIIIVLVELVVLVAVFFLIYRKFLYQSNEEKPDSVTLNNVNDSDALNPQV